MADPLYLQIAEDLRQKIVSGEIPPGAQLPTELELREQYGNASRNTVRDAIKSLTTQGLLVTRPGRGTFVVEKIKPFIAPLTPDKNMVSRDEGDAYVEAMRQQGGEATMSEPRVEVQPSRDEVATELEIEPGALVVIRHQRRFVKDMRTRSSSPPPSPSPSPSSLQTTFYPMEFAHQRGAAKLLEPFDIKPGATKYLEDTLKIKQTGYRDRLTVRRPNAGEAAFFNFADAATALVVVVHRTVYATDGKSDGPPKPFRFTVSVYPADRNHFVIEFGEVPPLAELAESMI